MPGTLAGLQLALDRFGTRSFRELVQPAIEVAQKVTKTKPVVVHCRSGVRSGQVVELMKQAGYRKVKNLVGGILRWSDDVDPTVPKY